MTEWVNADIVILHYKCTTRNEQNIPCGSLLKVGVVTRIFGTITQSVVSHYHQQQYGGDRSRQWHYVIIDTSQISNTSHTRVQAANSFRKQKCSPPSYVPRPKIKHS